MADVLHGNEKVNKLEFIPLSELTTKIYITVENDKEHCVVIFGVCLDYQYPEKIGYSGWVECS